MYATFGVVVRLRADLVFTATLLKVLTIRSELILCLCLFLAIVRPSSSNILVPFALRETFSALFSEAPYQHDARIESPR